MEKVLSLLLMAMLFSASTYVTAAIKIPGKDVGTKLDRNSKLGKVIYKKLGLSNTTSCRVSLPGKSGTSPRVAKVAARLAVWAEQQTPGSGIPSIYLGRRGDKRVTLFGPALDPYNMGVTEKFIEINDKIGSKKPMGADKSNRVHWIGLSHIGAVTDNLKSYKDGILDGDAFGKMGFKVKSVRLKPRRFKKPKRMKKTYEVDVLVIKSLGKARVYGVCIG